jgi:hypothetical protein
MTEAEKTEMRDALYKAIMQAISEMGVEAFKGTSFFMSSRR